MVLSTEASVILLTGVPMGLSPVPLDTIATSLQLRGNFVATSSDLVYEHKIDLCFLTHSRELGAKLSGIDSYRLRICFVSLTYNT